MNNTSKKYKPEMIGGILSLLEEIIPTLPKHQQIGVQISIREILQKHEVKEEVKDEQRLETDDTKCTK